MSDNKYKEQEEELVDFDPSVVERALQRTDYKKGWCYAKLSALSKQIAEDKDFLRVSPNWKMFNYSVTPCRENDPDTAVGRGLKTWQCLPFQPKHWDTALANGSLAGQLRDKKTGELVDDPEGELQYNAWKSALGGFSRDTSALMHAVFPGEVPGRPYVNDEKEFVYNGEVLDVDTSDNKAREDAYNESNADMLSKGTKKAKEVWNTPALLGASDGVMVLAYLDTDDGADEKYKDKLSVKSIRHVDDTPFDPKTKQPAHINTGDEVVSVTTVEVVDDEKPKKASKPAAAKGKGGRR